jgi:hypothetical protein
MERACMPDLATPATAPDAALTSPADRAARGGRRPSSVVVLAALFAVAVAAYVALALNVPLPFIQPDEHRYSALARSLVHGHGFVWRPGGPGQAVDQTAALYVYFIAPMWWLLDSGVAARDGSRVLGTLALCSQVVPVWLVARNVVGPLVALIPALLAVAGTWMVMTAFTLTEVLALPLATAALCCLALALQHPGSRSGYAAVGFTLLATWARLQLVVLIPVLLLAVALDVLRCAGARRRRLKAHRTLLLLTGGLNAGLALGSQLAPGAAGDYASLLHTALPPMDMVLRKVGLESLELILVSGFLPVLLAAGGAVSPAAWRDDRTGPLLIVFWLAALATTAQAGVYLAADLGVWWGIERYLAYAMPLGMVLMVALLAEPRLLPRRAFVVAGLLALPLLLMPPHPFPVTQAAAWAVALRVWNVTGLDRSEAPAVIALAVVLITWVVTRGRSGVRAVLAGSTVLLCVFAAQDQAVWQQLIASSKAARATFPGDLGWIDHHARGPVAVLGDHQSSAFLENLDYFNGRLAQVYVPAGEPLTGPQLVGRPCGYLVSASGAIVFSAECGAPPHRFLLQDRMARLRFYDETRSAQDPAIGRIVELSPRHPPRLQSKVVLPCPSAWSPAPAGPAVAAAPTPCAPALRMSWWLDRAARVTVTFRGSAHDHIVTLRHRRWRVRAGGLTTVRLELPQGHTERTLALDWALSDGPSVVTAEIRTGGRTRSLIS